MKAFEGKVAVVTGGTGALGRHITKALLEAGALVWATYIVDGEVPESVELLGDLTANFHHVKVDVLDPDQVEAFVAKVLGESGRVDVLVNVVGGYAAGDAVDETDVKTWDFMMDLNLKSAFLMSRATVPTMIGNGGGRIVNISSRSGLKGEGWAAPYSISKSGVILLTEALAEEGLENGITANAVMPSIIDTPANREAMPRADHSKWVHPEDIAKVVMFLSSDEAAIVSGAAVPAYGRA